LSQDIKWKPILKRSTFVAAVVGTILNLINQSDAMMGAEPIVWGKIVLTYMVPFVVSTYAAWSALKASGK